MMEISDKLRRQILTQVPDPGNADGDNLFLNFVMEMVDKVNALQEQVDDLEDEGNGNGD